ncbi:hypothetical protein N7495_002165 [Penicillium taxi]|uniref:uncharacterized protein n=1 Tax=Penicillium taxi TaxID=168475 RepID=UPI0025454E53|nr:uncharacterized protein N7495_002165 [Penicillium taxi]KAJ5901637.1 hypothetical protein N7495_002165 [Penicillium taxi]
MLISYTAILLAGCFQLQSFGEALAIFERGLDNSEAQDEALHSTNVTDDASSVYAKRAVTDILYQNGASPEMKFVSTPEGYQAWHMEDYAFQAGAGSGVTVYVHDSGINIDHDEFTWDAPPGVTKGTVSWLYPTLGLLKKRPKPISDPIGHGTCVADKIVGQAFGIAKGANLKMVPFVDISDSGWMEAGLEIIIKDIKAGRKNDKDYQAVVNLSYQYSANMGQKELDGYRKRIKQLVELDAVIVIAAGNSGQHGKTSVNRYPALFALEFPDIIVVGSVDIDGLPSKFTQGGSLVKISAPGTVSSAAGSSSQGFGIQCASSTDNSDIVRKEGTSFSAPTVAGLAAYLLSIQPALRHTGQVAQRVKAKIISLGYTRRSGGLHSIWNGLSGQINC